MRLLRLPLAVKVPLVVIVFMAAVAVFVSERVLARLEETQTKRLEDLANVHLDGLSSSVLNAVIREDVWEVFDILDRARHVNAGLKPTETVVATEDGRVLASSDPRTIPSGSHLPASYLSQRADAPTVTVRREEARAVARRDLSSGGQFVGSLHATFDVGPLLAERRSVLLTLLATNLALTFLLAVAAWLVVHRMMQPVRVLATHLQAGVAMPMKFIPEADLKRTSEEFRHVFSAFNLMASAARERELLSQQLAEEERLASLGRLASGMAHEINNPLGGLFNAIDTLRQHGGRSDVRHRTLELVERGLKGIRNVVRTTLVTYRPDLDARHLKPSDIDDLKLLIGSELRRRSLSLKWVNNIDGDVPVTASVIRQVVLNLLLNACRASPEGGAVSLSAKATENGLEIAIVDSGPGLPDDAKSVLAGHTDLPLTGTGGAGLGLWMVRRLVREVGGSIAISQNEPSGTGVYVHVPASKSEVLAHVA